MKKKGMDLTEGPIFKKLIIFVLPIIATSLLQQFYNTADQMVVGKFAGVTAHSAVGATNYVTNMLINLFVGLSIGATVTCAKYSGAKDDEGVCRTVHTAYTIAVVGGVFIAVVGVLLTRPLLQLMGTPADILEHSVNYMSIILAGTPFSLMYNYGSGLLRARGDSKRPLYILSISGLVNVLLNLLFVIKFDMGEVGVGLATVISQLVSSFAVVVVLMRRDDALRLDVRKLKLHKIEFVNILKVGIPSGLNAILFNLANISLQSTINVFGKEYISANSAAASITNYVSLTQGAFGTGIISFVGQNYGAKKYDRIDRVVKVGLLTVTLVSVVMATVIVLMPRVLLGLFTTENTVINCGVGKLLTLGTGYILFSPSVIFAAALRGIEKPKTPMVLNIVSVLVSRIIWIYVVFPLFPEKTMFAFNMLFLCFPISWVMSSSSTMIAYYKFRKKFAKTSE